MKKITAFAALCCAVLSPLTLAQSQIFLLHHDASQQAVVEPLSEIGNYSNQPAVTEQGVYYSFELGSDQGGQNDIFFFDFATKTRKNISNTPTHSEYSPTLMPEGNSLSAVVVEADGSQRLWQYPLSNAGQPHRIADNGLTIGYHAWGESDDLVVFALGEPHQAVYFHRGNANDTVHIVDNPGRSFSYSPRLSSFTFVAGEQNWLSSFNPTNKEVKQLFRLPQGVQDYTWVEDGTIAYASHGRLYQKELGSAKPAKLWHDLNAYCDGAITRLSYLKEADKLAFVCEFSPPK